MLIFGLVLLVLPALTTNESTARELLPNVVNPVLMLVDQRDSRRKDLIVRDKQGTIGQGDGFRGYVRLYAEFWVTNTSANEWAKVVRGQVDEVDLSGRGISRWNEVIGMVWELASTGGLLPVDIAPRTRSILRACSTCKRAEMARGICVARCRESNHHADGPVQRDAQSWSVGLALVMMPQPGDRSPGFMAEPSRCWAMIYDRNLQATHCRDAPSWTGRWSHPRAIGGGGC